MGAMLPQAIDVLAACGAKYLSQIIWRKERHRLPVRTCQEPILPASFGGRQNHNAFPSIFDGLTCGIDESPANSIRSRTPDQNRCDLFARQHREGFDCGGAKWGSLTLLHRTCSTCEETKPHIT
jgi:hypothetical protein